MSLSQYMIVGQFIPGNSYLHKLDPRSKLLFVFAFIVFVFLAKNISDYLFLLLFLFLGLVISAVPLSYYYRGLRPIFWIILFTTILHLTMTKGGDIYFQWKMITIYEKGIEQAIFIALRLILLILLASMLTLTTSPIDLTMALERLMKPLRHVKVPVHELALMMSISLRFIPTLLDEADKIMNAQRARGANFDTGPIAKRLRNMIAIIIPLFISAFKRADELAIAMESRGYRGEAGRTRLRTSVFSWRDFLLLALYIFLFMILILI